MPVTRGDLVTWVGTGVNISVLPNMDGVLRSLLTSAGWQNVQIQRTATGLTIQATAPQSWPTSQEIGNDFQSKAQSAGWHITYWTITSAGAAWLAANNNTPSNLPGATTTAPPGTPPKEKSIWDTLGLSKLTPQERSMVGIGVVGVLLLLLMPD